MVLLLNVIEHSINPAGLIKQSHRVLKDDGLLIISAPFLYIIHEQPVDYWRFTQQGLIFLCTSNGFKLKHIEGYGRVFKLGKEALHQQNRGLFIKNG
jgi:SAM-dependent methyltransferase